MWKRFLLIKRITTPLFFLYFLVRNNLFVLHYLQNIKLCVKKVGLLLVLILEINPKAKKRDRWTHTVLSNRRKHRYYNMVRHQTVVHLGKLDELPCIDRTKEKSL
jgi:hypothetical protein